jgi:hypothetical protein
MELFDAVKSSVDSEVVFQATLQVSASQNPLSVSVIVILLPVVVTTQRCMDKYCVGYGPIQVR